MLKVLAILGSVAVVCSVAAIWSGSGPCGQVSACGDNLELVSLGSGSCGGATAAAGAGSCEKADQTAPVSGGGGPVGGGAAVTAACGNGSAGASVNGCSKDDAAALVSTGDAPCAEKAAAQCSEKTAAQCGQAVQCSETVSTDGVPAEKTAGKSSCCPAAKASLVNVEVSSPLDALKGLVGRWEATEGESAGAATEFKVSSNGSIVVETMFPGQPHEMTNVYSMDGDRLLLTHYCAAGNQPRLQLVGVEGNTLKFEMIDAANLPDRNQLHMCALEMTLHGDSIVQKWTSTADGKVAGHKTLTFQRVG
ncbi:MAG: hypothetical protein NZ561_12915, partial [Phycisphaerae bacterium]|nr:hypothetical protein [Phycisphaerae bacterium]